MKLTDTDKKVFEAIAKSPLGRDLADYLERLCDHVCDSRSWGDNETRESSNRAAQVIKEHIREKILPKKEIGKVKETFE